jgi:rare lipoprotein A
MNKNRQLLSTLMAAALLFASLPLASLANPSYAYADTATLRARAQEASGKLDGLQGSLDSALGSYNDASSKLAKTQAQISENEERARQLEKQIAHNQGVLERHVNFLYRTQGTGYIEILFSSRSVAEFTSALEMIDMLASNDANTISSLTIQNRKLKDTHAELVSLRTTQEDTEAALKRDVQSAQKALDDQQAFVDGLDAQVAQALEDEALARRQQQEATQQPPAERPSNGGTGGNNNSGSGGSGGGGGNPTGVSFTGLASWYNTGHTTANGEPFNPMGLTAAHKTLPFNTMVRVTYKGRSVVVRINDRGPFTGGRVLDLSEGAAIAVGLKSSGVGMVTAEILR